MFFSACGSNKAIEKKQLSAQIKNEVEAKTKKRNIDLKYPEEEYLSTTGIGRSEKLARENAIAEMSNYFESKVTSDISNKVKSIVTSGGERVTRKSEQQLRIISSVELKGVEITGTWYDQSQMFYYAVAALHKKRARNNWQREIDLLDNMIEAKLSSTDILKSPFAKLSPLKEAEKMWIKRATIVSRLNVLGYADRSKPDYEIKKLISQIAKIKASIKIKVNIKGHENASDVADLISEMLTKKDYLLTKGTGANIYINGNVRVKSVNLNSTDWKFSRATISISIVDAITGSTIAELSENKRQGHSTYEEAGHKAVKKASQLIKEKLSKFFNNL